MRNVRLLAPLPPDVTSAPPRLRWSGVVTIRFRRHQPAKAAFAAAILGDCAFERRAVEIGPIDRHENELAVGGLPKQEIGEPLLAAGANDQVGIGNVGRVQMAAEKLRRNVFGGEPSLRDFDCDAAGGARDLLAGAIVERHDQRQAAIVPGQIFRLDQEPANIAVEIVTLADNAHPHIGLVQFGKVVADEAAQ